MNSYLQGWLTVRIKPRQDIRAQENLMKQGYSTYFPYVSFVEKEGKKVQKKPLFPGYGFIKLMKNQPLLPINSTLGVIGIVHFGSYFPLIESETLKSFRFLEKFSSDQPLTNLKSGDEVEILKGPLKGLIGIVSLVKKHRVEVLYFLLNQSHKIDLKLQSVKSF